MMTPYAKQLILTVMEFNRISETEAIDWLNAHASSNWQTKAA